MTDTVEVVQKIAGYLNGKLDLVAFRDWMVGAQFDAEDCGDEHASELLWELEGYYAEFSDNRIPESVWRDSLRSLTTPKISLVSNTRVFPQLHELINYPVVVEKVFQGWSVSFGTLPAAEYVSAVPLES